MTEKPAATGPASAGPAPGAGASKGDPPAERVVIRDKRKIDHSGAKGKPADAPRKTAKTDEPAAAEPVAVEDAGADAVDPTPSGPGTREAEPAEQGAAAEETGDGEPAAEAPAPPGAGGLGAELEALRAELEERTRDLQRVSAEYANYRKRVDRDRGLAAEQTIGQVLSALLPVLDDLDRAREHGDLVGPFGVVAEQLTGTLAKFGLSAFGEKGDPFDPTRHEAVAHLKSAEVTEPSCFDVLRRGYLLGDRLLRPALVAVADPE